jgi:hypothetical protein
MQFKKPALCGLFLYDPVLTHGKRLMARDLRTLIYKLDLFYPASNTGYGIDAFYFNSDELTEYSCQELQTELETLVSEGLLRKENDRHYWSTKNGKIGRNKYLGQRGILQKPLVEQQAFPLEDLILAIVASSRVDFCSGFDNVPIDAVAIYLHTYSDEEIKTALEKLTNTELIKTSEYYPKEAVHITGRGLHKYKTETRLKLGLGSTEGICRLLSAPEKDERFSGLGFDTALQENLEKRWNEMRACADNGAYLAACIMLGSILEGALLAKLKANISAAMTCEKAPKDRAGSVKSLNDWTLAEYILVATELRYIPKSVEKHSHELRDTRNLVHPQKQISDCIDVDESLYRISKEVAETVISTLSSS